ncbi:Protein TIFY 4B [Hirschfeldia incana]|nr:Protein TIFY 4B [Hirschfeldia incana]
MDAAAGVSSAKSILEKPLKLLTEDDISQLTREDCRKFLKDKGMRRPSWNKSQAIQQVLSLKALFEPGDDSGAAAILLRKILVSPPNPTTRVTATSAERVSEVGAGIAFREDDGSSLRRDSPRSAEFSGGSVAAEKDSYNTLSPRSPAETSAPVGQMTIFYSGKVSVYNGVPPEKARSIMHFAANPIDLPEHGVSASARMISRPMTMSKENMVEPPHYVLEKANASRDSDAEGQANRKVSLQRYLEKRKDRRLFKSKKTPGVASSRLEMYLNRSQPVMNAAAAYSLNLSGGRTGGEQHESPEIQTRSPNLSVDLNSDLNSEDY